MALNKYLPEGSLIATSDNRESISSLTGLENAMASGKICEANAVLCDRDMNLTVDLGGVRGIIPKNEAVLALDGGPVKDIAIITRVSKPVCFKVLGFEDDGEGHYSAILSRRAAQYECMYTFLMSLQPGDVIPARITHLEHFGAFADIGCGIVSLLPIDCISVSRISHPRDRFVPGMQIRAVVKSIDCDTGRVCITHKELLGTWEENAALFAIGQTVSGVVRSVEDYGIFVELTPNLAGLAEYRDDVCVGQRAAVYIKNIIPDRMKIKLVLIDGGSFEQSELCGEPAHKLSYFGDFSHLDCWRYSPSECAKVIETDFANCQTV